MSVFESSITLDEVFAVATARRVPLAPELAGYLVLEVADGARNAEGSVEPHAVYISEEGTVALVCPKKDVPSGDAETSVRTLLGRLLEASGSATPALSAAAKRKPGSGLSSLIQELETALIPVNRAAGRRALARFAREVRRITLGVGRNALPPPSNRTSVSLRNASPREAAASSATSLPPLSPPRAAATVAHDRHEGGPSESADHDEVESLIGSFDVSPMGEGQMSRDLKAIAGLDPTPPPKDAATLAKLTRDVGKDLPMLRPLQCSETDAASALVTLADSTDPLPPPPAKLAAARPHAAPISGRREKVAAEPHTKATRRDRSGRISARRNTGQPGTARMVLVVTLLLVAVIAIVWKIYPSFSLGKHEQPVALAPADTFTTPAPHCKIALVVRDVPTNAEILLRMGQSPLDVEQVAMGARLEFVATAEGYAPKRAVVKDESPWEKGPDGRSRVDVPIQLEPSRAKRGSVDPWPPAEPGTEVGRGGTPGTARVVSNVRGAEVWLLAGLGPEARIENLRCDGDMVVLLAGPPNLLKRLQVSEKDIASAPVDGLGVKVVTLTAK